MCYDRMSYCNCRNNCCSSSWNANLMPTMFIPMDNNGFIDISERQLLMQYMSMMGIDNNTMTQINNLLETGGFGDQLFIRFGHLFSLSVRSGGFGLLFSPQRNFLRRSGGVGSEILGI